MQLQLFIFPQTLTNNERPREVTDMILTRMERSMHEEVGDTYLRGAYEILVICTLCIRAELDFFCRDECGAYE